MAYCRPTGQPSLLQNECYTIIEDRIGQGGAGAVYKATDTTLNKTVALKHLTAGAQWSADFEHEARLLARLDHPGLPAVTDYFNISAGQFLVMKYIPGDDLGTMLRLQAAPFLLPEVLRWTAELVTVLDYLHGHTPPIIHRDIKPHNLKIGTHGELMLLDFGLAKGDASGQGISSPSVLGYTPQYAPLEQIQGTGTDVRSDWYSLAATLYQLAVCQPPADALTRAAAVIRQQPDPLLPADQLNPTLPHQFAQTLASYLALNIEQRPADSAVFRQMLQTLMPDPPRRSPVAPPTSAGQTTIQLKSQRIALPTAPPAQPAQPLPLYPRPQPLLPPPPAKPAQRSPVVKSRARQILAGMILFVGLGLGWPVVAEFWGTSNYTRARFPLNSQPITANNFNQFIPALPLDNVSQAKALDWSSQGRLAVADANHQIRMIRPAGEELTLQVPGAFVTALDWSQNGTHLLSGSEDGQVQIWDTASMNVLGKPISIDAGPISAVLWGKDDQEIIVASKNDISLYDGQGELIVVLQGHSAAITTLAFNADKSILASASIDGHIILWKSDGNQIIEWKEPSAALTTLAWLPDDGSSGTPELLASGAMDGTVKLWHNLGSQWALKKTLELDDTGILSLSWTRQETDDFLVASAANKSLYIWHQAATLGGDPPLGPYVSPEPKLLTSQSAPVKAVAWSPDGRYLATIDKFGAAKIWITQEK